MNPPFQVPILGRLLPSLALAGLLALCRSSPAQTRPSIGYIYPAGGQQNTTFEVRLGGQGLDEVNAVLVSGTGVTARVTDYYRRLNNQEFQLLNEQLRELKRTARATATATVPMASSEATMTMSASARENGLAESGADESPLKLIARIEKRSREHVETPACASIASLVFAEVIIASNAAPGEREVRVATRKGLSNPLVFHVGQLPEQARKPMQTARLQVLGKEAQSLRKRPAEETERRITLPCTVNGQIASGEVNRYRFSARKGQRLVFSTCGRQLIPFIADAVPGWFQPVLTLYNDKGKEIAYDDDFHFKPDPTILFEVAEDGEYVLAINDSLYRGREDFVYRISAGELPFVTSHFPLGAPVLNPTAPLAQGWNLDEGRLPLPPSPLPPGEYSLAAAGKGLFSNRVPFVAGSEPEVLEQEPNDHAGQAQAAALPIVINGRIGKPGDWDVFRIAGKSNDWIVGRVQARRFDSPLDSVLKVTDESGSLLAFNDDCEDLGAGVNTHHADSYLKSRLPADGDYFVHIGDTAGGGGEDYAYRLRLGPPQPDFDLRVVPSSVSLRSKSTATVSVYALRRDGFSGPIKLALKNPPAGFSAAPVTLLTTQTVARLTLKTDRLRTTEPVALSVTGTAKIGDKEVVREAVPAEDRMQAFLWRHLVPARDFRVVVFAPSDQPAPKRVARARPSPVRATNTVGGSNLTAAAEAPAKTKATLEAQSAAATNSAMAGVLTPATNATLSATNQAANKAKFTKQQIAGRLRQLKLLFEEGLLTDDFYNNKVAECEAAR